MKMPQRNEGAAANTKWLESPKRMESLYGRWEAVDEPSTPMPIFFECILPFMKQPKDEIRVGCVRELEFVGEGVVREIYARLVGIQ